MCLVGEVGRPAALAVERTDAGPAVTVTTAAPLAAARTAALTADKARDALGALGGTPYRLADFEFAVGQGAFLAVGDLKDLRRRALSALDRSVSMPAVAARWARSPAPAAAHVAPCRDRRRAGAGCRPPAARR